MQIQFVREGIEHYCVIDKAEYEYGNYEENLFRYQDIPFFMPYEIRRINGQASLYYKLSFRTSIEQALDSVRLTSEKLNNVMESIVGAMKVCEDYLLSPDNIVWDADKIFIDIDTGWLKFIYYENDRYDHRTARDLVMEILQSLDRKNENEAVRLLKFYNVLTEPELSVERLKRFASVIDEEIASDEHCDTGITLSEKDADWAGPDAAKIIKCMMAVVSIVDIVLLIGLILNVLTYEKTGFLFIGMAVLIILVIVYMHFEPEETPDDIMEEYKRFVMTENNTEKKDSIEKAIKPGSDSIDCSVGQDIDGKTVLLNEAAEDNERTCKENSPAGLCLKAMDTDKHGSIHIGKESVVVGSMAESCSYLLPARGVSRLHAKLVSKKDGIYILDMNSTNGTFLNGEAIQPGKEYKLEEGDMVSFAAIQFYVVKEGITV